MEDSVEWIKQYQVFSIQKIEEIIVYREYAYLGYTLSNNTLNLLKSTQELSLGELTSLKSYKQLSIGQKKKFWKLHIQHLGYSLNELLECLEIGESNKIVKCPLKKWTLEEQKIYNAFTSDKKRDFRHQMKKNPDWTFKQINLKLKMSSIADMRVEKSNK